MVRALPPSLPVWEQTTCWLFGVGAILYGIYKVHLTSMGLKSRLQYVEDGLDSLGGKKDVADYEWEMYSTYFCWRVPPLLVMHIAVSRCLALLRVQGTTKKLTYVVMGTLAASYLQSWRFLVLLSLTPVPFYLASTLHSLPAVWVVSVAVIYVCNSHIQTVIDLLDISTSTDYFVVIYLWASAFLRCTCFAIERVWSLKHVGFVTCAAESKTSAYSSATNARTSVRKRRQNSTKDDDKQKKRRSSSSAPRENGWSEDRSFKYTYGWPVLSEVPDFLDFLVYVFYVPLVISGPPVPYKSFKEQLDNPTALSRDRFVNIIWKFSRVGFWFCFNNVMLHFLYFQAFGHDPDAMKVTDKWTLATTAYLIGQFMTNKYVVIYGAMTQTARLDGIEFADNPACISYIYVYSDMWKSFDRGLHDCLKRYIYIPLGGSRAGVFRTELSTLATFCFIGYWHGGGYRYMMWAVLNFVEVNLELLGSALEKSSFLQQHVMRRLSTQGQGRLRAVMSYPVFLLATTSNMFFLAGPPFAEVYLHRICLQWDSFLTLGLVTYCMTQNSKHLQRLGHTNFS